MTASKTLGSGRIVSITATHGVVRDSALGEVEFDIAAMSHNYRNVKDLRSIAKVDEFLVFSAKEQGADSAYKYRAFTAILHRNLTEVPAKITSHQSFFSFATARNIRTIFVPHTVRSQFGRNMFGFRLSQNQHVKLRVMRQPLVNGCEHLAYEVEVPEPANGGVQLSGVDPKNEYPVVAVIVEMRANAHFAWSTSAGLIRLPETAVASWMHVGAFIECGVKLLPEALTTRCQYVAKRLRSLGDLFEVEPSPFDETKLCIKVDAVVTNLCQNQANPRGGWLFNDYLGRILLPPRFVGAEMEVGSCVRISATWTNAYEDFGFTAIACLSLGHDPSIRNAVTRLLLVDDNWQCQQAYTPQTAMTTRPQPVVAGTARTSYRRSSSSSADQLKSTLGAQPQKKQPHDQHGQARQVVEQSHHTAKSEQQHAVLKHQQHGLVHCFFTDVSQPLHEGQQCRVAIYQSFRPNRANSLKVAMLCPIEDKDKVEFPPMRKRFGPLRMPQQPHLPRAPTPPPPPPPPPITFNEFARFNPWLERFSYANIAAGVRYSPPPLTASNAASPAASSTSTSPPQTPPDPTRPLFSYDQFTAVSDGYSSEILNNNWEYGYQINGVQHSIRHEVIELIPARARPTLRVKRQSIGQYFPWNFDAWDCLQREFRYYSMIIPQLL